MAFDSELAKVMSDNFRATVSTRYDSEQRLEFERLLQATLGIKNLRSVQLWTRYGASERDFINSRLGEYELDLRTAIADVVINNAQPTFPTKEIAFVSPISGEDARRFTLYMNDEYVRAYATRFFPSGRSFVLEYAADSNTPVERPDLESPEFDDLFFS